MPAPPSTISEPIFISASETKSARRSSRPCGPGALSRPEPGLPQPLFLVRDRPSRTLPRSARRQGSRAGEHPAAYARHPSITTGRGSLACRQPHGQPRVIRQDRVDPHQDRVMLGPKVMGHGPRKRIAQPQHPARSGGNGTVKRLGVSQSHVRTIVTSARGCITRSRRIFEMSEKARPRPSPIDSRVSMVKSSLVRVRSLLPVSMRCTPACSRIGSTAPAR